MLRFTIAVLLGIFFGIAASAFAGLSGLSATTVGLLVYLAIDVTAYAFTQPSAQRAKHTRPPEYVQCRGGGEDR